MFGAAVPSASVPFAGKTAGARGRAHVLLGRLAVVAVEVAEPSAAHHVMKEITANCSMKPYSGMFLIPEAILRAPH